jgi:ABC-type dipeptide/oligopeptide/nickel transport system ATPase component
MSHLLELRELRTRFWTPNGPLTAVDGVSLSLDAGQTLVLLGESGCGKSVTALSILRLLPPRCRAMTSAICAPMRMTGFRLVIGS